MFINFHWRAKSHGSGLATCCEWQRIKGFDANIGSDALVHVSWEKAGTGKLTA